jgi:hypothetical protein
MEEIAEAVRGCVEEVGVRLLNDGGSCQECNVGMKMTGETISIIPLCPPDSTYTGLRWNWGFRGEKPATNGLHVKANGNVSVCSRHVTRMHDRIVRL